MSVEAPERIFIAPNRDYENIWGRPFVTDDFDEDGTEYVRADKLAELAAWNARLDRDLVDWTKKCFDAEAALAEKDKEIAALEAALDSASDDPELWRYWRDEAKALAMKLATTRNAGGKDAE